MKSLIAIWSLAVITGVATFGYINTSINALIVKPITPQSRTFKASNLQGNVGDTYRLQPAVSVKPTTVNPQANQTGGNGTDNELQPALGYGALGWTMQ